MFSYISIDGSYLSRDYPVIELFISIFLNYKLSLNKHINSGKNNMNILQQNDNFQLTEML